MHRRIALGLATLALAADPLRAAAAGADDDAVVVIRGSSVSVARPLTPERALDGSAEVEIVRVEVEPVARARPPAPERELVVVVLPAEEPPPAAMPAVWGAAWPWAWQPGHPRPRPHVGPRAHFPPTFHPLGIHRGPVRNGLHRR
jgi:hypothetical protein